MTDKMICAASTNSGCYADAGGPFVCKDENGRFVLQGIVSMVSPQCKAGDLYTVSTRVTEYVDWIKRKIWLN